MAEIAITALEFDTDAATAWDRIAARATVWLGDSAVAPRDAIVLVPLAQHLALARRAFGRQGGWLPRVETTRTLAAALPPGAASPEGAVSFDIAQDRLRARQMLLAQAWARQWAQRDAKAFEQTVARLVDCAHRLARRSIAVAPVLRPAWEAQARALLAVGDAPGNTERLLARLAFEWVNASSPWPSDTLFALRPAAWLQVRAGGADALADAVLQAADPPVPRLVLQADPLQADPLAAAPLRSDLQRAACEDFEDESERTAAHLIALLQQGCRPLALIAQDRLLVRRVGALLARHDVPVLDETGWKLSTTRAAAGVMALLRAASPVASTDELLDWLKALPSGVEGAPSAGAVDALEQALRRSGCARRDAMAALELQGAADTLRTWAHECLAPLADAGRLALARWTELLRETLSATGQWAALQADVAGQQVLRTLRLDAPDRAWRALAETLPLRLQDFVQAVDEALEQAVFEPPAPAQAPAVVITPLRRAVLRPFAAAVLPGADDRRLGVPAAPDALLGEALSVALGLPSTEQRQHEEALALAHLLRTPQVLFLHRHHDEGETLGGSVLLERLALLRERAGRPVLQPDDPRRVTSLVPTPQPRPAPAAGGQLPAALSASAVEALRDCPYRFFSRAVLRLQERDELDDEAQKRDYGTWLHDVLLHFHQARPQPRSVAEDMAQLRRIAQERRAAAGLDADSFLPFEATFERFAAHYADWLQRRDATGAQWLEGESDREAAPPELAGTLLRGRIDRIDRLPGPGGTRQLIDYKTGPHDALRKKVREPLEDTQLAFYAALEMLGSEQADPQALEAMYLALDDSGGIQEVPHPEVPVTARVLVDSLAAELRRVRAGEPLPALGDGPVCEHCEARGLCRRDHWDADASPNETE
ncbi:PD-(D/E)XK nuclease family protein [Ideonella sp. BN130291]|uniref:PD-(D/E)XK nuclease family protein n=1 Tax=Ideonella sp. BN130291 TaxID=3112940 RepID=UPI002E263B63|nr:PD-(D/E)XK nuclease family protein [Ideonella sp. BN130291]